MSAPKNFRKMFVLFVCTFSALHPTLAAESTDPQFALHLRHAAGEYQGFKGAIKATGGSAGEFTRSCEKIRIFASKLEQPQGAANISICTPDNECVDGGIGYDKDAQYLQRLSKTELLYDNTESTSYWGDYLTSYLVGPMAYGEGPRRLQDRRRYRAYLKFNEVDGGLDAIQLGYSFKRKPNLLQITELIHNEANCVRPTGTL